MKKMAFLLLIIMSSFSFGAYNVGEIVPDQNWTDSNNEEHSIYELVASRKVVVFFWGDNN